jgi:hypothetical protein
MNDTVLWGVCRDCGGRVYSAYMGCGQERMVRADWREFNKRGIDGTLGGVPPAHGCNCRHRGLDFRKGFG